MTKALDLNAVVAKNLQFFMSRSKFKNPNQLGKEAKVSPSYIRYLLDPQKRTVAEGKGPGEGSPKLDKLAKLCLKLGERPGDVQVWELLHPDIEMAIKQKELYRRIEETYRDLPTLEPTAPVDGRRRRATVT